MKNLETGEYELMVGNRQLLSAFFIVVLLCGVAFAMGYVVGQNSPRSSKPQPEAVANSGEPRPAAAAPATAPQSAPQQTADSAAQPPADVAAKTAEAEAPPQPTTQPAREAAPAPTPPVQAPPGSYWQVGAFKLSSEAQPTLQMLRDGGMPASLQTGADNLVHLVVGPYADKTELNKARSDLERLGIKSMIRK